MTRFATNTVAPWSFVDIPRSHPHQNSLTSFLFRKVLGICVRLINGHVVVLFKEGERVVVWSDVPKRRDLAREGVGGGERRGGWEEMHPRRTRISSLLALLRIAPFFLFLHVGFFILPTALFVMCSFF